MRSQSGSWAAPAERCWTTCCSSATNSSGHCFESTEISSTRAGPIRGSASGGRPAGQSLPTCRSPSSSEVCSAVCTLTTEEPRDTWIVRRMGSVASTGTAKLDTPPRRPHHLIVRTALAAPEGSELLTPGLRFVGSRPTSINRRPSGRQFRRGTRVPVISVEVGRSKTGGDTETRTCEKRIGRRWGSRLHQRRLAVALTKSTYIWRQSAPAYR